MKNNIKTITCCTLFAAALAALPAISRGEDSTNAPPATHAHKKTDKVSYHDKVQSVDATAMTFTVNKKTIAVKSTTKITKDGKPAVFTDIAVGEMVSGSYQKDADGNLNAATVRIHDDKKPATPAAP